jgi:putative inorganic carbon (hco3(-)) transporter
MPIAVSRPTGRVLQILSATEWFAVLLATPALLFPSPARLVVALVVPLVWLGQWRTSGRLVPPTPLNTSLILLLVMVGISLGVTFDIAASLGKVSGVLLGAIVFWTSTRWVTTADRLRTATFVFVLAGGLLSIIGLLGTNWFEKFRLLSAVADHLPKAIRGVPGAEAGFHPNAVAGCLVLFIPLQVGLIVAMASRQEPEWSAVRSGWNWSLAMQLPLLMLTGGTLLLTQSRGAWAGMLVALGAFLTWHSRRTRVLAAIMGGAIVIAGIATGPERLVNLAISQSGPGMAGNVPGRLELWSRAIDGIRDFPLSGMGMNTFRKVVPILYPTFLTSAESDIAHAHNHLLQAALDLGIPGLVAYMSLWLTASVLLVSVHRRSGSILYRTIADGLGAGLIAHFCFSMTDAIPLGAKVGVLFWLTLALVVSLHQVAMPQDGLQHP